jgi:predicted ribosome quality control (RQC) complex YloA/Tae2 family protein
MFDVLTVSALTDELQETILDGRIQKLGLVDPTTIAAEIYAGGRRRAFVASADPRQPCFLLADSMPSLDPNLITPFGLQLRKYVRGGFLIGIEQPSLERMVRLSIVKRLAGHNGSSGRSTVHDHDAARLDGAEEAAEGEDAEEAAWGADVNRVDLVIEIMGRHSNIVLVDQGGRIMESVKRVTPSMSRVRPIMPRLPFVMPPVQDKPDPRQLTSPGVQNLLRAAKPSAKLAETLVTSLRLVSPQIGREAAFQLTGDAAVKVGDVGTESAPDLARIVRNLFEPVLTSDWNPHVYTQEGVPIGYAAIPMRHLQAIAEARAVESISVAVATSLDSSTGEGPKDHAQRRARLVDTIERELDKIQARLQSLQEQHQRAQSVEQLRTWGELIYAYLWQIEPGQTELDVDGARIPLDPAFSGKENAQAYFEQYRKAQKAGAQLPDRIASARQERDYLDQLRTQARQSDGFAAIEALRQEFEEHTGGRSPVGERSGHVSKKQQPRKPMVFTDEAGNMVYIGRSGKENDQVTFSIAGPDDTWLHARGVPGSHVVIRWLRPAEEEDPRAVETAAALAAWYSASRESGSVEVDIARRRHVRKIKGAGPGMVTYRNEHTIAVRPQDEDALKREGYLR